MEVMCAQPGHHPRLNPGPVNPSCFIMVSPCARSCLPRTGRSHAAAYHGRGARVRGRRPPGPPGCHRRARAASCIPTRCRSASTLVCLSLPWRCLDVSIGATVAFVAALAAAFAAAALAPLVPSARALAATATFGYTRARVSRCPPRRMPSSAPLPACTLVHRLGESVLHWTGGLC